MNIQHESTDSKGAFFISNDDGIRIAELTYSKNGDYRIILDHTEVSDDHRGEGLGKKLVYQVAGYARDNNIKILPLCSYARVIVRKNKEDFEDVT